MPSAKPVTKKRKAETPAAAPAPKKSPLAGLPQNHYAPPTGMSPDQLAAWRKEQRRERNRQSAAASRQQTKSRIEELEGEVRKYKSQYEEMKLKMEGMERQIRLLSELSWGAVVKTVTPPGSYPNSPSRSPVHDAYSFETDPQDATTCAVPSKSMMVGDTRDFFLPLFSFADCAPDGVSSHRNEDGVDTAASFMDVSMYSKEHLKPISRQA
jgi:hypothetical protein